MTEELPIELPAELKRGKIKGLSSVKLADVIAGSSPKKPPFNFAGLNVMKPTRPLGVFTLPESQSSLGHREIMSASRSMVNYLKHMLEAYPENTVDVFMNDTQILPIPSKPDGDRRIYTLGLSGCRAASVSLMSESGEGRVVLGHYAPGFDSEMARNFAGKVGLAKSQLTGDISACAVVSVKGIPRDRSIPNPQSQTAAEEFSRAIKSELGEIDLQVLPYSGAGGSVLMVEAQVKNGSYHLTHRVDHYLSHEHDLGTTKGLI